RRVVLTPTATTTARSPVRSIRYKTVTRDEGQQSGSLLAYRANSAEISGGRSLTAPDEPSSRDVIGVGERRPANRPPTKTNRLYASGRHMPSAPRIPPTISTSPWTSC